MSISNEYQPLNKVVVHEPGYEWNLVTAAHNMPEKYLIEDILFADHAAEDHREFTDCVRHLSGDDSVLEFNNLLADILDSREIRSDVVGGISALEGVGLGTHDYLLSADLDTKELAQLLVAGGYRPGDLQHRGYKVFFQPLPNLMFTRDLGMFVDDTVILSHPAKPVRRREGLLARYIFRNHPMFKGIKVIDILDDATVHGLPDNISLEGGDVLVLDSDTLLVGCGERTSEIAIDLLAKRMLTDGHIKRLVKVTMPVDRATMHLDTVFTIIGPDDCVYYPPFFAEDEDNKPCPCTLYELPNGPDDKVRKTETGGLFTTLESLGYKFPNRIPCGGDIPHYQTREQWTDGANLFAVKPQVAFIYERNLQTIEAFRAADYSVMTPTECLRTNPDDITRTVITLSGAELSRGRGGARCMTMPVTRT